MPERALLFAEVHATDRHRAESAVPGLLYDVPRLYKVDRTESVPAKGPKNTGQETVLNDFICSVKGGRRPQTDVFDNIYSVAMVFAAMG